MINKKTPLIKQSVGAQYICFATGIDPLAYATDIEKTEVVKSIGTSESSESTKLYASGTIYQSITNQASTEVSVEVVAFVAETLAKMRAETVDIGGLILSGGGIERPYFAYGKVVKLTNNNYRFEWFPKCQLSSNTDDVETSEDAFKEQNDTLTIMALPFNAAGDIKTYVQTDTTNFPAWLTEDLFFSKPVLTPADLAGLQPVG